MLGRTGGKLAKQAGGQLAQEGHTSQKPEYS